MNINEWIHFSIDDVILSFKWVYDHRPESIFEEPMLKKLREWHERYGVVCSLYLFEECEGFRLSDLQERYWKEMAEEISWMRFCWHRRKSGELTDNMQTEIDSFKRVKELICENVGAKAWTNIVRLHRWVCSEELLTVLVKEGIEGVLISDKAYLTYYFSVQDIEKIEKDGWVQKGREKETITFYKTELNFDGLTEAAAVKEALEYTRKRLRELHTIYKLHIFMHEWNFSKISECVEQYLDGVKSLSLPLYLNASVYNAGNLYFVACNSSYLYKLNLHTGSINIVSKLKIDNNCLCKFAALIAYKEMIWMVPWLENYIYVYDTVKGMTKRYAIPYLHERVKYRKPVQAGKYLWLLPIKFKGVVRIDMDLMDFDIFDEWPEGVSFPDDRKINFRMMCAYEGKLFLFRADCSHNIIVDMATGKMTIWNINIKNAFGTIVDGRLYLAPVEKGSEIKIYKLGGTGYIPQEKPVCVDISQELSENMQVYSYWYTERSGDQIFFMPHEAKSVLLADAKSGKISSVTVDIDEGNTMRPNPEYAMYEVHKIGEEHLIIPYMGNKLVAVSDEGILQREIMLETEVENIEIDPCEGKTIEEIFVERISCNRDWNGVRYVGMPDEIKTFGEIIYEQVGKD